MSTLAVSVPLGPIAREVLQTVVAARYQRLYRIRGGFAPLGGGPTFTRRIVNKLQRDGLLQLVGKYGDEIVLTREGFARALQLRSESTSSAPAEALA